MQEKNPVKLRKNPRKRGKSRKEKASESSSVTLEDRMDECESDSEAGDDLEDLENEDVEDLGDDDCDDRNLTSNLTSPRIIGSDWTQKVQILFFQLDRQEIVESDKTPLMIINHHLTFVNGILAIREEIFQKPKIFFCCFFVMKL